MNINPKKALIFIILAFLAAGCAAVKTPDLTEVDDGVIRVSSSPLMWQKHRSPMFTACEEAYGYVKGLKLGGYSDWRLPTKDELLDFYFVFDYGNADPEELGIKIEGDYWTSDEEGGAGFSGGWNDQNSCEITREFQPATKGYVRAVRP